MSVSDEQAQQSSVDNERPPFDKVIVDIVDYVYDYEVTSEEAYINARDCIVDSLGCALQALKNDECAQMIGPFVPGPNFPCGARIPGTGYVLDPIQAAFSFSSMIRWIDYNDAYGAAEWGHPSDNLGGILSLADYLSHKMLAENLPTIVMRDVMVFLIKAYEIQGGFIHANSFHRHGLDHTLLNKIAIAAVASNMLGLPKYKALDVVSHAWADGQPLRVYRQSPNTGSRKSWAAGDATSRGLYLAFQVSKGKEGLPSVLTTPKWGFYDVYRMPKFTFPTPYTTSVMENIFYKIKYPAEGHAHTAIECAFDIRATLDALGKTWEDIASIDIRTHEAAMIIINKTGKLYNAADRDHCMQYMCSIPLIFNRLLQTDYNDETAADPRIDELRKRITCHEDRQLTENYRSPTKRSPASALLCTLKDATVLPEVLCEYPVGHVRRRVEGRVLLQRKFVEHVEGCSAFNKERMAHIIAASERDMLPEMPVNKYMDLFVKQQ